MTVEALWVLHSASAPERPEIMLPVTPEIGDYGEHRVASTHC